MSRHTSNSTTFSFRHLDVPASLKLYPACASLTFASALVSSDYAFTALSPPFLLESKGSAHCSARKTFHVSDIGPASMTILFLLYVLGGHPCHGSPLLQQQRTYFLQSDVNSAPTTQLPLRGAITQKCITFFFCFDFILWEGTKGGGGEGVHRPG